MDRPSLSKQQRFEILKRDGFRCRYCGASPVTELLRVDHVVAVANGGTNDPLNLVTSCDPCNSGKGARPLDTTTLPIETAPDVVLAHAAQVADYLEAQRELLAQRRAVIDAFLSWWNPLPDTVRASAPKLVREFSLLELREFSELTFSRDDVHPSDRGRYFFGIVRNHRSQRDMERLCDRCGLSDMDHELALQIAECEPLGEDVLYEQFVADQDGMPF